MTHLILFEESIIRAIFTSGNLYELFPFLLAESIRWEAGLRRLFKVPSRLV